MPGWKAVATGAVCLGLLGGAAAIAAIPDSSGTISACVAKSNGVARIIDAEAGASCEANKEFALTWNQRGVQGPPGPPGPAAVVTRQVQVSSDAVESTFDGFDYKVASAACGPGEFVTGGGFTVVNGLTSVLSQVRVKENLPTKPVLGYPPDGPPNTWFVGAIAPTGIGAWTISAFALCATEAPEPPGPLP